MEHIAESELALYAFEPDRVPSERRSAIDRHTTVCSDCRTTLDFFMMAEEDLGDDGVWEPIVGSPTLDALRVHAERIAAEDREADVLLASFFKSPAKAAWTDMRTRKRFLTGGVVRRLNAQAHNIFDKEPLDALTLADAAISVAEILPDSSYPSKGVYELRGTAWKERANALRMLGEFAEALNSLRRAERAYRQLSSSALGLAAVAYLRATVLYDQQCLNEAAAIAEEAERGFAHLGDDNRRMSAIYLRGSIKYEAGDVGGAMALFEQVFEYGDAVNNERWIARASYALGNCEVDRGNLGDASMHFHKALALFREVGPATDRLNAEWGIARVILHAGKPSEAIHRLRHVISEFETRGMVTDAALAGLDVADALLAMSLPTEIVDLASRLFRVFRDAGMLTGALTAIAYMKEAAAAGTLTPATLEAVRKFLRRVQHQPDLIFAPPTSTMR